MSATQLASPSMAATRPEQAVSPDMPLRPTFRKLEQLDPAGPPNRAKSHGRVRAWLTVSAALISLTACSRNGEGEAGSTPSAASRAGSTATGKLNPVQERLGAPAIKITKDDIPVPLVGDGTKLSPSAIEIIPDQILPPDLPFSEEVRAEIIGLLRDLQPLHESLTSDHHDRWYIRNRRRLEALERDTRTDIGLAALRAFEKYPVRDFNVRRNLLRIAARVAPEESSVFLGNLAFTYGPYIEDRTEALLFYAEIAPEEFLDRARPYLDRAGRPFQTAPNDEFFATGWLKACEVSGEDPVPMMASVATNFALEPRARYLAVKSLKAYATSPLARAALETTLVESTGDAYIRRMSAQSVIGGYPREEACALLQKVANRESDMNFARFLDDVIQSNCR